MFVKYKFNSLFGKDKLIDEKYLIEIINKYLKNTCEINEIVFRLLKNTSVQNAADIIGHKDIKSMIAYKR